MPFCSHPSSIGLVQVLHRIVSIPPIRLFQVPYWTLLSRTYWTVFQVSLLTDCYPLSDPLQAPAHPHNPLQNVRNRQSISQSRELFATTKKKQKKRMVHWNSVRRQMEKDHTSTIIITFKTRERETKTDNTARTACSAQTRQTEREIGGGGTRRGTTRAHEKIFTISPTRHDGLSSTGYQEENIKHTQPQLCNKSKCGRRSPHTGHPNAFH